MSRQSHVTAKARASHSSTLIAWILVASIARAETGDDLRFYAGDFSETDVIGSSLPGTWRPFSDTSPWNQPISTNAAVHADSETIVARMSSIKSTVRFAGSYTIPVWVVNSDNIDKLRAASLYPFDTWDPDYDRTTDTGVPVRPDMWGEPTSDGHICIVDPFKNIAWEMSRYGGISSNVPSCSTFNVWDLTGEGCGHGDEGNRWGARGGRGSGFPIIAGLLRPEEIQQGEIRHALIFSFERNRKDLFVKPACRSDGKYDDGDLPIHGMRFQLDPALTDADFDAWGLTAEAKIVARALQTYGMYLGDNGGSMAIMPQLLDPDPDTHRAKWEAVAPGLYKSITRIPTSAFRIIDSGEQPQTGGGYTRAVAPLISPLCGTFSEPQAVTIRTPTRDAVIRYTLDGSEPTADSALYTAPIEITGTVTLKARAFHETIAASDVSRSEIVIESPDADDNGLPDDWELMHFGSERSTAGGASDDWDGDGQSNLHEYLAGTDPADPASCLALDAVSRGAGGGLALSWQSVTGRTYTVEYCANLGSPWQPMRSGIEAVPPRNVCELPAATACGFFRVCLEQ